MAAGDIIALIGVIVGVTGAAYGEWQRRRAQQAERKAGKAENLLDLRDRFTTFDDIHMAIRRDDWQPPHDWSRLEAYMGLFEQCKVLIDAGSLDIGDFERLYGHRHHALVLRPAIKERYATDARRRRDWSDFIALWRDLDAAHERRTGEEPVPRAPA